jgi:hypothetical protein
VCSTTNGPASSRRPRVSVCNPAARPTQQTAPSKFAIRSCNWQDRPSWGDERLDRLDGRGHPDPGRGTRSPDRRSEEMAIGKPCR